MTLSPPLSFLPLPPWIPTPFLTLYQALSKAVPAIDGFRSVDIVSRLNDPLEVRYVIANSAHMSSLLATHQAVLHYSLTSAGEDHHGLPEGARWSPVSNVGEYVTRIDVEFSASKANTRPGVDLPISHEQRDYTYQQALCTDCSRVPNSNFNELTGGATVSILLERMTGANDGLPVTNQARRAAVTRIVIVAEKDVARYLDDGFIKIDKNLLQQSNRGVLYIMYKHGSGRPLLDIRRSPAPRYQAVSGTSSAGVTVTIYVLYSLDTRIERTLTWTPCTGQDEVSL
jgi:hypothetical protein